MERQASLDCMMEMKRSMKPAGIYTYTHPKKNGKINTYSETLTMSTVQ